MTQDISIFGLIVGMLLMAVPVFFFHRYRTSLVLPTLSATARMVVQLVLIGFYLKYLFEYDLWYVNLLWGLIMVGVASWTAVQRTRLKASLLFKPFIIAFLVTALLVGVFFLTMVLRLDEAMQVNLNLHVVFSARYFIPIFGLLLGNMLGVNILSLSTYYEGIQRERQMYDFMLANGASRWEATMPFLRAAIRKSFNPCIANMAIMGIVALPGTMIGQILGGSDPTTAIKYQMMIVVITFVASMISLMITVAIAFRRSFDEYGNLKDVFEQQPAK